MRPRIADPRGGMSEDERDAPAAADGPRGAAARYMPCRAGGVPHEAPAAREEMPLGPDALRPGRIWSRSAASGCGPGGLAGRERQDAAPS
jgi:hypothetical protein